MSKPGPAPKARKAYFEFVAEFAKESDRAAVILGAAKLDNLLYHLLKSALLPSPSGEDDLLDGDSPLGTFSARIKMAYRLGLIDNALCRSLHLVRKIRNSFAHEWKRSWRSAAFRSCSRTRVMPEPRGHYLPSAAIETRRFLRIVSIANVPPRGEVVPGDGMPREPWETPKVRARSTRSAFMGRRRPR